MSDNLPAAARTADEQRRIVRERYADIATESIESGCCESDGCSSSGLGTRTRELGYDDDDLSTVVHGANLGLGCGNPTAIAGLADGETVLDLGSGAGFDCFLAAQAVGPSGRVVGVDMTPAMVEKARENAVRDDTDHVEFRLGEIEHLPVSDGTVDVIISNCVINLSPDKQQVFEEAFRVLRPGGRLAISDVVQTVPFPDEVRDDPEALTACVSGAATIDELERMLDVVGFDSISITPKDDSQSVIQTWDETRDLNEFLISLVIEARKP
ncbi:arsenite methyltransferase [Halegenticoccus tardaugens]|uniref:arsenite methyltransferase n=1 Tax=Halegenticoccus tardaugens TaxID=2071624 RepID=UPI00100BAC0E|nr:arsenite methyltransferase [Halegenticoccus tardaugens]